MKRGKKWPCVLFYNDLVHYKTRCRSCYQKYIILLNGKQICSSIVFNESQVTSPLVCDIRYDLEFYLFKLLTSPAAKCEECRVKPIMYEKVTCLQALLNRPKLEKVSSRLSHFYPFLLAKYSFDLFLLVKVVVAVITDNL